MRQKGGKYSGKYEDYFLISNNLFLPAPVPVRESKHHILMLILMRGFILIFVFIANFVLWEKIIDFILISFFFILALDKDTLHGDDDYDRAYVCIKSCFFLN
jgi:hypothetical protein